MMKREEEFSADMKKECRQSAAPRKGPWENGLAFEREVIDAIPVPVFFSDVRGDCLGANKALADLLGIEQDKLARGCIYDVLVPDRGEEYRRKDSELLASGGRDTFEGMVVAGDGGRRNVVFTRATVHDSSGTALGLIGAVFDLSELKETQRNLSEVESQKQAILDGFPGVMALLDCDLRVIWSNRLDMRGTGICAKNNDAPCYQQLLNGASTCEDCIVRRSIRSGKLEYGSVEVPDGTGGGEATYFELVATPVKDEVGRVQSVVVISRDVTDKVKLEKQLRHSQKMEAIGALAGGIAHDFNNVLTPIIGHAEIMRFRMRQSGVQDQNLDTSIAEILKAAKRAKILVDQILTFARSQEQNSVALYVHPIVKEALNLVKVGLPRTIEIRQEIDKECGQVFIDPVQLHQVLMNLCTNSFQAMEGAVGILTVGLAQTEKDAAGKRWVVLSVSDTGSGIEPAVLPRIFEPYFSTKDKSRGTGMGLAIVHGIISRYGGRIEVKSEVGVGSTFEVYLPMVNGASSVDHVLAVPPPTGKGEHILVVEDEEQVREVVTSILEGLGYRVSSRATSQEALQLFQENSSVYDLLISDLTVPATVGAELWQRVHAIRPQLPVVLSTGYAEQITPEVLRLAGASDYFFKPVSLMRLAQVVRHALDQQITGG